MRHPFKALALATALFVSLTLLASRSSAQIEDLVARIKPAIVLVEFRDALGRTGHGSGFIYDPSGYILTNHHVVEGTVDLTVRLADGRSFPASVVDYERRVQYTDSGVESDTDVAVLKINAVNLPTLLLGTAAASLRQGQDLLVLGYPGGVSTDDVSVTRGIVSAVRAGWVQTDAAIEPGNSGGPVVDREGRVVGLATFVTGRLRKIGGVVAMSNIREFARSALDPNAPRHKEMAIPGWEYVSPMILPRQKTFRISYDPGTTRAQPYVRDYQVTYKDVQDLYGAYSFTAHDSRGTDYKYYVDSEGLFTISGWGADWSYSFPEPFLDFPLPPRVGRSWDGEVRGENASQGVRVISEAVIRIDSSNEVVSTPAGSFSNAIKVLIQERRQIVKGSRTALFHATVLLWRAPNVGPIKVSTSIAETREQFDQDLLSVP